MTLYKLYETVSNITIGGWVSVIVILSLFVEISPIKLNPIAWLGTKLFAPVYGKIDKIDKKLDEHVASSYRTKILTFQDLLLTPGLDYTCFTKEQYDEVIDAITKYEKHCKDNDLDNGKCLMAESYIKRCYTKCLNDKSFAELPKIPI